MPWSLSDFFTKRACRESRQRLEAEARRESDSMEERLRAGAPGFPNRDLPADRRQRTMKQAHIVCMVSGRE